MNSKPSLSDYIVHAAYLPIYGLVKYIPSPIGDILRKMVLKLFGARIGPGTRIYEGVTVWYPYRIKLGTRVTLNEWVYLSAFGYISIGDGVSIGHRASILTTDHKIFKNRPIKSQELQVTRKIIGDDVFLGAGCIILHKANLGDGSVVGAGSVVVNSVKNYEVVAGNPAKSLGTRT